MENLLIQNKIKILFGKLTEPGYVLDNYYADGLINKLKNCADPEISFLESVPLVSDLIIEVMLRTENAHISVRVFLTRMLAIVSQNELHFGKVIFLLGDLVLKDFKEINSASMNTSLRVAYMEMALKLVGHDSGISWLIKTGVWKEILSLCYDKQTVFVVRQTYQFAAKFVWRLNDMFDEINVKHLLNFIFVPLYQYDFVNVKSMSSEDEDNIGKTLEPMLQILLSILTVEGKIERQTIVISALVKEYNIPSHLYIIIDRLRRDDMTLLATKSLFWLGIARLFLTKPPGPGVIYNHEDFLDISVAYFNTIQRLVSRRNATLVLDFCNFCNLIWTIVWSNKSADLKLDGRTLSLHHQLLFICLVPSLVYIKQVRNDKTAITNERLDEYINKLLNCTCVHTARAAYALRDLTAELDTLSVTLQSVKRLTCLKNYITNSQANIMFQAMFHILRQYDPTDDQGDMRVEETYEDTQEKVLVMTAVLDIVLCLIKNHNINWHESLEIICLYGIVYNILKRPNLSCKFIVTALHVISVTVKKFHPPNLSLLMESQPGSAMHELGKLIYMKMHDLNWEVRDSALELLLVCTEISFVKYPPFQKQILENNLINVAATIAFNDHESYVQVSALKCIGAASKINPIAEQLKAQYPNIQEQIIAILRNSQEGIVRKEACNVLTEMYQNLKLTPTFKHVLYEHMVSSALTDFHWEVQLNALRFWKIVIQNLQTDQGMLDGTFPPVTFSKETRKIVTLNETEIQRRLIRISSELASIGCLTVLSKLLHEDTEVEIIDSAMAISFNLLNILKQYKVPELLKPSEKDPRTVEEIMCSIREGKVDYNKSSDGFVNEAGTTQKSDNVIEGIIKVDDINLLANIYEKHMNLQSEKPDSETRPKITLYKYVTPYLFVKYLNSKDFKEIVEQKKKWKEGIRSVSSLLDDVLGIYEVNDEANSLDCY